MIRTIQSNKVFLTFDDGPDTSGTTAVLDVLARKNIQVTFFVVANKLRTHQSILTRAIHEGHSFGNHSLDHRYWAFFRSDIFLRNWIQNANLELQRFALESVGFRPPAGVVSPPLRRVLKEMGEPLILWSHRYFDTVFPFTVKRAEQGAALIQKGDIILLHDCQRAGRSKVFSQALSRYLDVAQDRGLQFAKLERPIRENPETSSAL